MEIRRIARVGAAVLLAAVVSGRPRADAATILVPEDFPGIQSAVDASAFGDTILVGPGTYTGLITLPHRVALISVAGAESTTIDAQGEGVAVLGVGSGSDPLSAGILIQGFRITGGQSVDHAGAIEITGRDAVIRENILEFNNGGNGALFASRGAIIEDNVVQFNSFWADPDGVTAMVVSGGVSVQRNLVRQNGPDGLTVMIIASSTDPQYPLVTIAENVIVDNMYPGITGNTALDVRNGGTLRGNTIARNEVSLQVGLQTNTPGSAYEFTNNIVDHAWHTGVSCSGGPHVVACNDVWGTGTPFTGGCAGSIGQDGNFAADPLFCCPEEGDYRLRPESPCAPGNSPPGCGLIGALPVGCGTSGVSERGSVSRLQGLTVRPNPVTSAAEFAFGGGAVPGRVEIYDAHGRLVDVLAPAMVGPLRWRPDPRRASGVYFARLAGGPRGSRLVKFLRLR